MKGKKKTGWPAWTYCPARHPVLASPLFNPPILFPMHQLYLLSSSCFSFTSRLRSCCTIPCYAGTQSPSNSGFTRDFLSSTGSLCPLLIFFFSYIAERARGMVGQLSGCAKAKKVKLELLAGVFSPARKQKNRKQKTKTNKTKQPNRQKGPVKISQKW